MKTWFDGAKQPAQRVWLRGTLLVGVVLLGGWLLAVILPALDAYGCVRTLQAERDALTVQQAFRQIDRLAGDLAFLRRSLSPLVGLSTLESLRGSRLAQAGALLDLGTQLSLSAREVARGLEPLANRYTAGEELSPEGVVQSLEENRAHFAAALDDYRLAMQASQRVDAAALPAEFREPYARLDGLLTWGELGLRAALLIPAELGAHGPRHYLLLAQNNDELRATGGFISGIGVATLDGGKLTSFGMGDSYQVDDFTQAYPQPPLPLQTYMLAGYWLPRDANWSPDFPTAARDVQRLYALSTGQATDGVIAFDQSALQSLLAVLGPLALPETGETVSAGNVEAYLHAAWASGNEAGLDEEWWKNRKNFMGVIGEALIDRLLALRDPAQLRALGEALYAAAQAGHLLVYLNDAQGQALLADAGLDGSLAHEAGDFVLLVDSNVGFNKMDAVVRRSLHYQVDLSDLQRPRATLSVAYDNPLAVEVACEHVASYGSGAYQDMQQRCYWDYWRVFWPAGDRLLNSQASPIPADWLLGRRAWEGQLDVQPEEGGLQSVGGLVVVPAGESRAVSLQADLPPAVLVELPDGQLEYRLELRKQAGLESLPVAVELRLPAGCTLLTQPSGGRIVAPSSWQWAGTLAGPVVLRFVLAPGAGE